LTDALDVEVLSQSDVFDGGPFGVVSRFAVIRDEHVRIGILRSYGHRLEEAIQPDAVGSLNSPVVSCESAVRVGDDVFLLDIDPWLRSVFDLQGMVGAVSYRGHRCHCATSSTVLCCLLAAMPLSVVRVCESPCPRASKLCTGPGQPPRSESINARCTHENCRMVPIG
jgi:hypothetical protein